MKLSPQKRGGRARARKLAPPRHTQIARRAARVRGSKGDARAVLRDARSFDDFCRRHAISRLHLFGSILREDFSPKSDVDFLYQRARPFGYDEYCDAVEELEKLLHRRAHLVNFEVVARSRNPFRKREILGSAQIIYDESS